MRVVAGTARGVPLVAPRGAATRPVTDRVKETLFDILGERVVDAVVLDLYAGSGAIGIEALSRGAAWCTFVERGREATAAIGRNLERTRVGERAEVVVGDVAKYLEREPTRLVHLAVLDPPYEARAILAPLTRLVRHLAPTAVVVVKHFWRTEVPPLDGMVGVRRRRFGETTLTFLERRAPEESHGA